MPASAAESSRVSAAPPQQWQSSAGTYPIFRYWSSAGRWPTHSTLHPALVRSLSVGTVAAVTSDASEPLTSKPWAPNAYMPASAAADGSPDMTLVFAFSRSQRSHSPPRWSA